MMNLNMKNDDDDNDDVADYDNNDDDDDGTKKWETMIDKTVVELNACCVDGVKSKASRIYVKNLPSDGRSIYTRFWRTWN